ncbi:gamma-glutamyltransferase [Bradyrhizobium sp. USDA 4506]
MLSNSSRSCVGPPAVAAPGSLAGLCGLANDYGTRKLPQPAIKLARDGFPLVEFNVEEIARIGSE